MRAFDVHRELTLLGCSSEVHALVDDLELDFGSTPFWFRCVLSHFNQSYKTPLPKFKYVYQPRPAYDYVQGKLFEEDCYSTLRQIQTDA